MLHEPNCKSYDYVAPGSMTQNTVSRNDSTPIVEVRLARGTLSAIDRDCCGELQPVWMDNGSHYNHLTMGLYLLTKF